MKVIGWLIGIGTMLASAAYMIVSLNRWEWNRALFYGLILLIAEVALATGLILRKLSQLAAGRAAPPPDSAVAEALRDTRPDVPARFKWLDDTTSSGQLSVFITFAVAGGVVLSGIAWLADRIASRTTSRVGEAKLIARLQGISYPAGGLLGNPADAGIQRLLGPAAH